MSRITQRTIYASIKFEKRYAVQVSDTMMMPIELMLVNKKNKT